MFLAPFPYAFKALTKLFPFGFFAVRLQVVVLLVKVLFVLVDGFRNLVVDADSIVDKVIALSPELFEGFDSIRFSCVWVEA